MIKRLPLLITLLALLLPALPCQAQDTDDKARLMELCLSEGNPQACCDCGYQVLRDTFNDQELAALAEGLEIVNELEKAYAANDQARMDELETRMQEVQQQLPDARFNDLDAAVEAQCGAVCPQ
mgnify:CR=1 FL=1